MSIRDVLKSSHIYASWRRRITDKKYREIRERYASMGVGVDTARHLQRFKDKIESRGYSTHAKIAAELRVLAVIPSNWAHQKQIYRALSSKFETTLVDYRSVGLSLESFQCANYEIPRELFFNQIKNLTSESKRQATFDIIICYLLPWDFDERTLSFLKDNYGCPIVNISFDDKNWWDGIHSGRPSTGLSRIARFFDLNWTSSRVSLDWHWFEGSQAIYLPEGVNIDYFSPSGESYSFDVAFVGSRFGERKKTIDMLRKLGLNVFVAGPGWESGPIPTQNMVNAFRRSKILLGMGNIDYSRELTNLKGRDFECPSIGTAVYLTSYNFQLAECFHISREIMCYRGDEELIEQCREVLRDDRFIQIGRNGRERCISEHTWEHRFETLFRAIGLVSH